MEVHTWVPGRARSPFRIPSAVPLAVLLVGGCAPGSPEQVSEADVLAPRVVALAPSLTELVISIGGAPHLAARTDYDTHVDAAGLPSVGGGLDPNLEVLVALGIELAFVPATRDSSPLVARLTELGIEAEVLRTQTVGDIHVALARMGAVLDRREAADSVSEWVATALREVSARVADRPPVEVLYVVWTDPPMTSGPNTFVDELIGIAGGHNVFSDAAIQWPTVSFEAIVERDPALVLWPRGEMEPADAARLREMPGWREVGAVQAGRVEILDGELFNRPGPGVVEAATILAALLHPEAF